MKVVGEDNAMSVAQIKNPGDSASNIPAHNANGAEETRRTAKNLNVTALHEGGIVLSGSRAIDFPAAERFRILRAKIERLNLGGSPKHVISITSAVPEEGKSLIACNLARALAMDPRGKAILVDCDLRKPAVHRYFGIPFSPGLSDVLVGTRSLSSVLQSVEPGLDIITAGSPVIDATRAVELPQLAMMLDELKKHYRYVIVDCPPVLLCPEPLTISTLTDGTIMVVRAWQTNKRLVRDAVNLIGKEKFIGAIVNDARDALNEYGYYGYYGYDYRSPSKTTKKGKPGGGKGVKNTLSSVSQLSKSLADQAKDKIHSGALQSVALTIGKGAWAAGKIVAAFARICLSLLAPKRSAAV